MNLSFQKTIEGFVSGRKKVTRRFASLRTIKAWQNAYDRDPDCHHLALTKGIYRGGKGLGYFRLTTRPYLEPLSEMPERDLPLECTPATTREEFAAFVEQPLTAVALVIRFENVEVGK